MNIHGKAEECSGDDDVTKNEELLASLCFASPEPIMKWFVSGIENYKRNQNINFNTPLVIDATNSR